MRRIDTDLPGVCLIQPQVFEDERGFFMETFSQRTLAELGIVRDWVQDNHSKSERGVLRGLHYQLGNPQAKLVRATRGRVFDVAVDVRSGSPTFGRWTGAELSEDNKLMLFAPEGFAHGFVVLSEIAEFQYKCSDFYTSAEERAILWNDSDINITWPLGDHTPTLSPKDASAPMLRNMPEHELPVYSG